MGRQKHKKKKSLSNRIFWKFYTVLVILAVVIIGGDIAWSMFVKPPEIAVPPTIINPDTSSNQNPDASTEDPKEPVEGALVRKENFYNILLVGCDDGHGNADTIMVAGYDITKGEVNLVSIPRDTMIDRSWSKFPKLNAAFGRGGVDLLRDEISTTLGIPIDFYVTVDLSAFVDIVDAIGGLDFYVPQDMYHDDEGGFIIDLKEGQQTLSGRDTLELVRYRGYSSADIGRTEMQQKVLKALAKQILSWNSITKFNSFIEIFNSNVKTDMSLSDMLYFAQSALSVDMDSGVNTHTLSGRGDAKIGKYDWCYELDSVATVETVNEYLNPYTTPLDLEDMKLVKADSYHFD